MHVTPIGVPVSSGESTCQSSSVTALGSAVECCPPHQHLCKEERKNKNEDLWINLAFLNHVLVLASKLMDMFNHCEPLTNVCIHDTFLLIRLH